MKVEGITRIDALGKTGLSEMKALSILKLGVHYANRRVWVASQNIIKAGFSIGDPISIEHDIEKRQMRISKPEKSEVGHRKISGRKNKTPIIDIKNALVSETLGKDIETIEVRFYEDCILIQPSKKDQLKRKRKSKSSLTMFELFCGGGVLHDFFKSEGFTSLGGLEFDPRYAEVFDSNHSSSESVTICAPIEDVSPSDYPKGVHTLISGIPCTSFSNANIKLMSELKKDKLGQESNEEVLKKRYQAESLVYHVLRAIEQMNPKQVVIEQVEAFSVTSASYMLRTILLQMGFHLSETIVQSFNTKRKRWCLIANMGQKVDLSNLPTDNNLSIGEVIGQDSLNTKQWCSIDEAPRFKKASATVGLRSHLPSERKTNTFTTHSTRSTEPCLKKPNEELYAEFSIEDIAKIHGVSGSFKLPEAKTVARQILGQGVTSIFKEIAKRAKFACDPSPVLAEKEGQLMLFS